jgi:non-specific protein-tyrosine kinase
MSRSENYLAQDSLRAPNGAGAPIRSVSSNSISWRDDGRESLGLVQLVQVVRQRLWLILACIALSTAAAVAYVATADTVYEAEAQLSVQPVSGDNTFVGLNLVRESNDPRRDVQTVANLVATPSVGRLVMERVRTGKSLRELLKDIEAAPVADSGLVAITAKAGTPRQAARLANAFAAGVVADRDAELRQQLARLLPLLRERLRSLPGGPDEGARDDLLAQLGLLEGLRASGDPTVNVATRAEVPEEPVAPRPVLSILAGVFVGAVLGLCIAFAVQVLDPRLRREDQLRRLTRLPLLARIPKESGRRRSPLRPERLSPGTIEAYRMLRATLAATRRGRIESRSIVVTGAAASEGKTTTALNLAASLALAGHSVILMEADLRRPTIGSTLGIEAEHDITSVVLGTVPLEDALVRTDLYGENLELLLAKSPDKGGIASPDALFLPTAQSLIADAKRLADFVVIDSPPLVEVVDGLAMAQSADEVLLVVRLGRSPLKRISELGELLGRAGVEPVGFAVIGVPPYEATSSYYSVAPYGRQGKKLLTRR